MPIPTSNTTEFWTLDSLGLPMLRPPPISTDNQEMTRKIYTGCRAYSLSVPRCHGNGGLSQEGVPHLRKQAAEAFNMIERTQVSKG